MNEQLSVLQAAVRATMEPRKCLEHLRGVIAPSRMRRSLGGTLKGKGAFDEWRRETSYTKGEPNE